MVGAACVSKPRYARGQTRVPLRACRRQAPGCPRDWSAGTSTCKACARAVEPSLMPRPPPSPHTQSGCLDRTTWGSGYRLPSDRPTFTFPPFSFFSTTRPVSPVTASPNSLLFMNISAAHTPPLRQPTSARSKVGSWGAGRGGSTGLAAYNPGAIQTQASSKPEG